MRLCQHEHYLTLCVYILAQPSGKVFTCADTMLWRVQACAHILALSASVSVFINVFDAVHLHQHVQMCDTVCMCVPWHRVCIYA